jgi:hypothetical protein
MPGNTWRHNPPSKAHILLSEMFENGKIADGTTPKAAHTFHPEFSRHTLAVFSNNFRQLRQLHLSECNSFLFFECAILVFLFIHFLS